MKKEDIRQSISLIGPSSVGKSLISAELSNKTQMPVICIDDLLLMIDYEKNGKLNKSKDVQKLFAKKCIEELRGDPNFEVVLRNPTLRKREIKLLNDMLKLYNFYLKLFGSLKPFYKILDRYQERERWAVLPAETIMNLNIVTTEIILKIFQFVDQPVIFDLPASFGWFATDECSLETLNIGNLKKFGNVDFSEIKIFMESFLNTTQTVVLCPGEDYEKRNAARDSLENKLLIKYMQNYFDNAKIAITTNAVFYNPENKFLQRRSWLDAEESLVKDKLKNKGEIANICDEILSRIND